MKKKKDRYRHIWKLLHFKYKLTATNENTLEEIWNIRASLFSGLALFIAFATMLVFATSLFIITTPIRYYLPGYLDSEVRHQAVQAAFRADSLEQQLQYQELYINNLKSIFAGTLSPDSAKTKIDTMDFTASNPLLARTEREKEFTGKYEEEEKYNLSVLTTSAAVSTEGVIFSRPVKGVISTKFNPAQAQYGIVLETAPKTTVSAVLEGTVVFTGYDINDKYTVQIQHRNGFVSIYRYNTSVLQKAGNKVRTGEGIALLDADPDSKKGSRLGFELWYKGNPVNPGDYISF